MSKSYWRTTIVAGLTVLAACAIAGFILGFGLGEQSGERNANTDSYARHAQDEINSACAGLDGIAQTKCIVRVVEATNEHERSENDLIAQQNMGRWALLMLIATVAMAITTAFGVYYVWRTLNITRDIGEKQVRAYVSVESIGFSKDLTAGGGLIARMTYKNSGQSPAINVRHELQSLYIGTSPQTPIHHSRVSLPPVLDGPESAGTPIASGGISTPCLAASPPIPKTAMKHISDGFAFAVIRGWIKYDDVFGAPHETHFFWVKDKDALDQGFDIRLIPYGNSAD